VSEIRSVGRHTLVYGLGAAVGKLASFLMLPVYTRYLTPADYGVLELLGTTVDLVGMVAGVGLAAGVFKFHAEQDDPRERRLVMSTAAVATSALAAATCLLGILLSPLLTRMLFGAGQPALYFQLFFLLYLLQSISAVPWMLVRAQGRPVLFVTLQVAKLVGMLSLNIYFVIHLRMGLMGVLAGNLLATGGTALFLAAYLVRHAGLGVSRERLRGMTRFGAPVVLWSLGSFVLAFSDRYFLNHFAGAAEVGVYSLGYRFGFLLSAFAVVPFSQVWEPRRFEIARRPDAGAVYTRMFVYLNLAMACGAAAILLFVDDVLRVMVAPAFVPAARVVPLVLAATVVQQWTGYCNLGLYLKNATGWYAASAVAGVAAALALNFLLIPRYGMMGAAWATLGAYVLRFGIVYALAQARYPIDYAWRRVAAVMALLAGAWAARALLPPVPLAASLAEGAALLGLLMAALYLYALTPGERASLRALLPRRLATSGPRAA
jgi:O-antigen/teichoic acid export membrane protein